jgi:predicted permease
MLGERLRAAGRWTWLEHAAQDARYAFASFRRTPVLAVTVIVTLAIALGATTAVFSVIDAASLRRIPTLDADRLVNFHEYIGLTSRSVGLFPTEEYDRFRDLSHDFSDVAAVALLDQSNIGIGGKGFDPGRVRVALVSGNYFRMYRAVAERGRVFTPDDDRVPSGHSVAVVSHDYWIRRLGGATDVLDRTLSLHGTTYHIIGVIAPPFTGDWIGRPADIWVPTMMQAEVMVGDPGYLRDRGPWPSAWLRVVGRLAPGVTRDEAQSAAALVHAQSVKQWEGSSPDPQQTKFDASRVFTLLGAAHGYSPQRDALAQSMRVLAGLVAIVLLIAGANVAGLLLVRAASRQHEMALRFALGASASRLARQLLVESLMLTSAAGALGLVLAAWGGSTLAHEATTGPVQADWGSSSWSSFDVRLNGRVVAFAIVVGIVIAVLFGLAPSVRGSGIRVGDKLKTGGAGKRADVGRSMLGRILVVVQVALSMVLVVAAGLLVRTLDNLQTQDLGFDRRHLLLAWTQAGATGRQPGALRDLYRQAQQRISELPGVAAAAVTNRGSLDGFDFAGVGWTAVQVSGWPVDTRHLVGGRAFVTPGYFGTMGVQMIAGRDFTEFDTDSAPRVAIVNEAFAKFYFGDVNPVGHRIRFAGDSLRLIVGEVADVAKGNPRDRAKGLGFVYLSYRDAQARSNLSAMTVVVRAAGDPRPLLERVRMELRAIDPTLPVLKVDTIDEQLDDVLAEDRLLAALATFFGTVALLLAALGLYGLIAYTTSRRTSEIGTRMALGATPGVILRMVVGEGLALMAIGIAMGLAGAAAGMRVVAARLFNVGATDPTTIGAAALVLLIAAGIAGMLPALRAARLAPVVALRHDP